MITLPGLIVALAASAGGTLQPPVVIDCEWTASNAPQGKNAPRLVDFARGHALRFSRAGQQRVDLRQGPGNRLRLDGPFTLEAVVQLEALPPSKGAVISKWETRSGGRSYELGVNAFGWPYFTVSASGNWDRQAAELVGNRSLRVGVPYHVAAVCEPGVRMALFVGGRPSGETKAQIPDSVFDSDTPVWLGNRFGSDKECGWDGLLAAVRVTAAALDRAVLRRRAVHLGLDRPASSLQDPLQLPIDLDRVKERTRQWYGRLQDPGAPCGAYRLTPGRPPDMYASADIAWIRWMMADLNLTDPQRQAWISFLQDQQNAADGTYRHLTGHCPAHAFCHATGALNMLGGAHRYQPRFLNRYRNVEHVPDWLDQIDWVKQWGASHDIWGAGLPLACSADTPEAWRIELFRWLDGQVDPQTGFWRRGKPARSPLESLGGAFHIWPIYAAMQRPLPYPQKVIDHVLKLQRADGSFDGGFGYGNMDGVWVLGHLVDSTRYRRKDVLAALEKNVQGMLQLYNTQPARFFSDAHSTESRIATLAILECALPRRFHAQLPWRNPWQERALFVIHVDGKE